MLSKPNGHIGVRTAHQVKRGGGRCGYDAEAAQAAADLRARRPKTPKLAGDPVLAAAVGGLLADRMSPHAISAQLRSEGHGICAETVYAACYASIPQRNAHRLAIRASIG